MVHQAGLSAGRLDTPPEGMVGHTDQLKNHTPTSKTAWVQMADLW